MTISSALCFDAYVDDEAVEQSLMAATLGNAKTVDGTLAPGKKLKGQIGYEVSKKYKKLEINVKVDAISGDTVPFVYEK